MIQRIQSIFLTLAIIVNLGTLFFPVWKYQSSNAEEFVTGMRISEVQEGTIQNAMSFTENVPQIILFGITVAVSAFILFIIFQFNDRKMQMKMVYAAVLGTMMQIAAMAFLATQGPFILGAAGEGNPGLGFALPIVAAILLWLAAKRIKKDEDLVRSVDRIR